jgi:polysaccharide biosynthesis protein PelF
MAQRPTVLLTTEGTYPYYLGGVSVWCDRLVHMLPEWDFQVFAITHAPDLAPRFPAHPNLVQTRPFPLWGTEEPGASDLPFSDACRRKLSTSEAAIRQRYLPVLSRLLRCLLAGNADGEETGAALEQMHDYFTRHDYAETVSSREAWVALLAAAAQWHPQGQKLTIEDAVVCGRWLHRYLSLLACPVSAEVDLVHASMAGLAGIPGILHRRKFGTPYIVTEHGVYLRELYASLRSAPYSLACKQFLARMQRAIIRANYHHATVVTALCDYNRQWQIRSGAEAEKVQLLPNGVDEQVFHPRLTERPAVPTATILARIYRLKGIDVAVRAAALVKQRVPNVRFQVFGEVSDPEYYEGCVQMIRELGLEDTIMFSETREPARILAGSHVLCVPSISEAMPYVVLEALLSGCPVVSTAVGCVPGILEGCGVVVPPGDAEALASGLLSVLGDGEAETARRRSLAAAGLARAREQYTIRRMEENWRKLYRSTVQRERIIHPETTLARH